MGNPVLFPMAPDGSLLTGLYPSAGTAWQPGADWRADGGHHVPVSWEPARTFKATLRLTEHIRGRSAAHILVQDRETGARYHMCLATFMEVIKDPNRMSIYLDEPAGDAGLILRGWWTFKKRGQACLLVPAEAPTSE